MGATLPPLSARGLSLAGAALSSHQRLVPIGANEFYIVSPHSTGAIGFRFLRNTPATTPAASIDAPNPIWRLSGAVKLPHSLATSAIIADAVANGRYWAYDDGAEDIAVSVGGVFGGSYHGGVGTPSLNIIEIVDQNGYSWTVDPLKIAANGPVITGHQFRLRSTYTITWPTGPRTLTVTDYRLTINRDGSISETVPTGAATLNSGDFGYIGSMLIANSLAYDQFTLNALGITAPVVNGRTVIGMGPTTPNDITLTRSDTGDFCRFITNAPTLTNFTTALNARGEIITEASLSRSKVYYRVPTNAGSWAAATSTKTFIFGSSPAIATPARTNLLSNGDFSSALTGPWTVSSGAASIVSGALQLTRQAGTDNRVHQAVTCSVGKTYMLSFDVDVAGNGGQYTLGITAGSNTGALINAFSPVAATSGVNTNRHLFTATQTTHYLMLYQGAGTAGQVVNFDNAAVWQLD